MPKPKNNPVKKAGQSISSPKRPKKAGATAKNPKASPKKSPPASPKKLKEKIKEKTPKDRTVKTGPGETKSIQKELENGVGETPFPVIGIGASAGGLEAIEEFFHNVPENSGMSFIVVSHTDPGRTSLLPDIIQRKNQDSGHPGGGRHEG